MCNSESNKSCGLERMNASDVPLSAVWRIQLYKDEEGPVVVTDSDDDDAVTDSACSSKSFGSSKALSTTTTNKTLDSLSAPVWNPPTSASAKSFFSKNSFLPPIEYAKDSSFVAEKKMRSSGLLKSFRLSNFNSLKEEDNENEEALTKVVEIKPRRTSIYSINRL